MEEGKRSAAGRCILASLDVEGCETDNREVAGGERRSWIVSSRAEDGRERRDVLNARSAEEAARMAALGGWGEVVRVEPRR